MKWRKYEKVATRVVSRNFCFVLFSAVLCRSLTVCVGFAHDHVAYLFETLLPASLSSPSSPRFRESVKPSAAFAPFSANDISPIRRFGSTSRRLPRVYNKINKCPIMCHNVFNTLGSLQQELATTWHNSPDSPACAWTSFLPWLIDSETRQPRERKKTYKIHKNRVCQCVRRMMCGSVEHFKPSMYSFRICSRKDNLSMCTGKFKHAAQWTQIVLFRSRLR